MKKEPQMPLGAGRDPRQLVGVGIVSHRVWDCTVQASLPSANAAIQRMRICVLRREARAFVGVQTVHEHPVLAQQF